jgi:hypothetical protein
MIKFIIPAIIIFFVVLFWEKISEIIYKKFKIKINYIAILVFIIIMGIIFLLLYN